MEKHVFDYLGMICFFLCPRTGRERRATHRGKVSRSRNLGHRQLKLRAVGLRYGYVCVCVCFATKTKAQIVKFADVDISQIIGFKRIVHILVLCEVILQNIGDPKS